MEPKPTNPLVNLPGAIIIAAAIIAIAIIWAKQPAPKPAVVEPTTANKNAITLSPIKTTEHILGNPAASIVFVEFSDPSCPYCKTFNPTMENIMTKYGATGNVAWVYRHYPLDKPDTNGNILHANSGQQAEALECSASLGGNAKFWEFEKAWYASFPLDGGSRSSEIDKQEILKIAKNVGFDTVAFNDCIASNRFKDLIEANFLDGVNAGVNGTPSSFLVLSKPAGPTVEKTISNVILQYRLSTELLSLSGDKKIIAMSGAMPEPLIKSLIESILTDQKASATK